MRADKGLSSNIEVPMGDVETPSGDVEAPFSDVEAPSDDVEIPSDDVEAPSGDVEAPSGNVEASPDDVEAPLAAVEVLPDDFETPQDNVEAPTDADEGLSDDIEAAGGHGRNGKNGKNGKNGTKTLIIAIGDFESGIRGYLILGITGDLKSAVVREQLYQNPAVTDSKLGLTDRDRRLRYRLDPYNLGCRWERPERHFFVHRH